ncbi:MAG: sigma-54-dependent Fis family transcriptional regulator, partial [Nitrospirae bacterium]
MDTTANQILIVDDEPEMCSLLSDILKDEGCDVETAASGEKALAKMGERDFAVVITDLNMKGMPGLTLLKEIKHLHPETNVIIMTAFGSIESAIEAMKQGAYDYVTKPVKSEEISLITQKAVREASLRREVISLRRAVGKEYSFSQILGKSKPMQAVFELIRRITPSPSSVLITGESGTGKELVARAIHYNSPRAQGPFIPVNCAAIPENLLESEMFGHMKGSFTDAKADRKGLFEEAQGGTLFLDEISELPLSLQAKLLRVLQEKEIRRVGGTRSIPVDARVIVATNLDLAGEVKAKRFREDLYYRMNVIEVHLPALRERTEDIPLLALHFVKKYAEPMKKPVGGLSEGALALLMDYHWPGNVRELENVIERGVTLTREEKIGSEDLPQAVRGDSGDRHMIEEAAEKTRTLAEVERAYILRVMEKTAGNKYQAAQVLGIDRKTLYRKLDEI